MYRAAQPAGAPAGAQPGPEAGAAPRAGNGEAKKGDGGVIDAEYVDVEEKK